MNEVVRYHHLINLQHYYRIGLDRSRLEVTWGLLAEHAPVYFEDVVCSLNSEVNVSQSIIDFVERLATTYMHILTLADQANLILTGKPDLICHLCTKGNHCLDDRVLAEDIYTYHQTSKIMIDHHLKYLEINRDNTPPAMQINAQTLRSLLSLNLLKKSNN